jgi:hypothetical protein
VRLVDLNQRWIGRDGTTSDDPAYGGCGVVFDCPHCYESGKQIIAVHFDKPLDGGPSRWPNHSWKRTGETFDTLTLEPSIDHKAPDADGSWAQHWHGWIRRGAVVTA